VDIVSGFSARRDFFYPIHNIRFVHSYQHRRIVIDPCRTSNTYREFVNYSYATDKDGNILSVLPDKDNHTIDATAYALDRLIYRRNGITA
ncbi:MAG: hypothetical protein K2O45_04295, partial [Oscillospiraceae bacterium]|nr:hypothetical protein [Oscillospiraceae bacterium]